MIADRKLSFTETKSSHKASRCSSSTEGPMRNQSGDLHRACAAGESADSIRHALSSNPEEAAAEDSDGKLPLELLAGNEALFDYENTATFQQGSGLPRLLDPIILNGLTRRCGLSRLAADNCIGTFTSILVDWIRDTYRHTEGLASLSQQQHNSHADTEEDLDSSVSRECSEDSLIPNHVTLNLRTEFAFHVLSSIFEFASEQEITLSGRSRQSVRLSANIVNNVSAIPSIAKMLLLIENEAEQGRLLDLRLVQCVLLSAEMVGPWLIAMLGSKSEHATERAVDYLGMISVGVTDEKPTAVMNPRMTLRMSLSSSEPSPYTLQRQRAFEKLGEQTGLPLVLLALGKKQFDRAAKTDAVQWVLDKSLFRPSSLFILFIDISSFVVILVCHRLSTYEYFQGVSVTILATFQDENDNGKFDEGELVYCYPSNFSSLGFFLRTLLMSFGVLYFLVRQLSAFRKMPLTVLISRFGFSSLIDIVAIIIATVVQGIYMQRMAQLEDELWSISSSSEVSRPGVCDIDLQNSDTCASDTEGEVTCTDPATNGYLRSLAAVATALLWLKALNFLKMVNRYLATFVQALIEITKDIGWFLVILSIIVIAFAQMFHTILYWPASSKQCPMDDASGTDTESGSPFCSPDPKYSYLQMYLILFGEFDMSDFKTTFSVFLFVLYTFAVVIIMLNVLIAIVSDSYDKSMLQSIRLFREARVLFVAQLLAFKQGIEGGLLLSFGGTWGKCLSTLIMLSSSVSFVVLIVSRGAGLANVGGVDLAIIIIVSLFSTFAAWWLSNEMPCSRCGLRQHCSQCNISASFWRWYICCGVASIIGSLALFSFVSHSRGLGATLMFSSGFLGAVLLMTPWLKGTWLHKTLQRCRCFGGTWGKCWLSVFLIAAAATLLCLAIRTKPEYLNYPPQPMTGFDIAGIVLGCLGIVFAGWWLSNQRTCVRQNTDGSERCTKTRDWITLSICIVIGAILGTLVLLTDPEFSSTGSRIGIFFATLFGSLLFMIPWIPQSVLGWLFRPVAYMFGLLLGRSRTKPSEDDDFSENWMGKLNHLEEKVAKSIDGSEDRLKAVMNQGEKDTRAALEGRIDSIQEMAEENRELLEKILAALQTKES